MKIKDIIELTKATSLICTDKEKEYRFTCCLESSQIIKSDYVYIPIIEDNGKVFSEIKKHLLNQNCKGFIINKSILDDEKYKTRFHLLMKEFSTKIEVLLVVRNVYNSALEIGEQNIKTHKPQVIGIAGTEEKSIVSSLISYVLATKGKTTSANRQLGSWGKFFEPMLMTDKKTKYCILQLSPNRKNLCSSAKSVLENGSLIFTKNSLTNIDRYVDEMEFIEAIVSCASDSIKNIFTYKENLIAPYIKNNNVTIIDEKEIETDIKTAFLSKKHILSIGYKKTTLKTENFAYYIPRCFVIAYELLRSLNISDKEIKKLFLEYKDATGTYEQTKLGSNNNYIVTNSKDHTPYSIKNALSQFASEYKTFKKVVLLSRVNHLGTLAKEVNKQIVQELSKQNFDTVIFVDLNEFETDYKLGNKKAYLKRFQTQKGAFTEAELLNLKLFLKGEIKKDTAFLVCTPKTLDIEPVLGLWR